MFTARSARSGSPPPPIAADPVVGGCGDEPLHKDMSAIRLFEVSPNQGIDDSPINWSSLAETLGPRCIDEANPAGSALALILGEDNLRASVDAYLTFQGGYVVARSVISHLRSEAAHDRCLEIWRSDPDLERRRGAVELFSTVASERDLPLISEFLSDPDPQIPVWGIRVLTQLAYGGELGEADSERYLRHLADTEDDPDEAIEQQIAFVREFLASLDFARLASDDLAAGQARVKEWIDGPCVDSIDWDGLHESLGVGARGGDWVAGLALERIIGEPRFRDAVDWCVDENPDADLACSVLEDVRPRSAGERCIEIWRWEDDLRRRRTAVGILCLVVVNSQLDIVGELLNDPDSTIQEYGAVILARVLHQAP